MIGVGKNNSVKLALRFALIIIGFVGFIGLIVIQSTLLPQNNAITTFPNMVSAQQAVGKTTSDSVIVPIVNGNGQVAVINQTRLQNSSGVSSNQNSLQQVATDIGIAPPSITLQTNLNKWDAHQNLYKQTNSISLSKQSFISDNSNVVDFTGGHFDLQLQFVTNTPNSPITVKGNINSVLNNLNLNPSGIPFDGNGVTDSNGVYNAVFTTPVGRLPVFTFNVNRSEHVFNTGVNNLSYFVSNVNVVLNGTTNYILPDVTKILNVDMTSDDVKVIGVDSSGKPAIVQPSDDLLVVTINHEIYQWVTNTSHGGYPIAYGQISLPDPILGTFTVTHNGQVVGSGSGTAFAVYLQRNETYTITSTDTQNVDPRYSLTNTFKTPMVQTNYDYACYTNMKHTTPPPSPLYGSDSADPNGYSIIGTACGFYNR